MKFITLRCVVHFSQIRTEVLRMIMLFFKKLFNEWN